VSFLVCAPELLEHALGAVPRRRRLALRILSDPLHPVVGAIQDAADVRLGRGIQGVPPSAGRGRGRLAPELPEEAPGAVRRRRRLRF